MYLSVLRCAVYTVLILVTPPALAGKVASAEIYTYRETLGENITYFYWKLEKQGQQRIVSVVERQKSFVNICSPDGATLQWQLEDPERKNKIVARREGDELQISGLWNGNFYEKMVEIGERPWFQTLSYSLKQFLDSEGQGVSFWMVRADTLEVIALRSEKKGEEEILLDGRKIPALRIEVRAEGFYSSFWHGTYWYRKSDKLFLMYRSVQGLPGTAETVVELIGEPGGSDKL